MGVYTTFQPRLPVHMTSRKWKASRQVGVSPAGRPRPASGCGQRKVHQRLVSLPPQSSGGCRFQCRLRPQPGFFHEVAKVALSSFSFVDPEAGTDFVASGRLGLYFVLIL